MQATQTPNATPATQGERTEGINAYLKSLANFGYENGMSRQQVFEELMGQPDLDAMISDEMCRSGYVDALLNELATR